MMRNKPPFRADHVGACCARADEGGAGEGGPAGDVRSAGSQAVEDREIERIIRKQEAVGLHLSPTANSPLVVGPRLSLGPRRRRDATDGHRASRLPASPPAEGARVDGPGRFPRPSDARAFRFVQGATAHAEDDDPGAVGDVRPGRTQADQRVAYPRLDDFFADLGQAYAKAVRAFADAGCRYLQLDEVFIAMLCDPNYRDQVKARGDDPEKLGGNYARSHQCGDRRHPARHDRSRCICAAATTNRPIWARAATRRSQEVLFHRANVHGYFMEFDTERAGTFEPLRLLPKGKTAVLGLVTTKTGQLESRDTIGAGSTRRPSSPISTNSA